MVSDPSPSSLGWSPPFRNATPRVAYRYVTSSSGWAVGCIMRDHRHKAVGRSRVPGQLFTVGALWSAEPIGA
jgi:hypothetical protein